MGELVFFERTPLRLTSTSLKTALNDLTNSREGDRDGSRNVQPGSQFYIIDYKGKAPRNEYAYQIRFYAWVIGKAGMPVRDALLRYLTQPVESVLVDVSPEKVREIENDVRRLEEALTEASFEASPGDPCEECPFGGVGPNAL